jgi:hypothetical protein
MGFALEQPLHVVAIACPALGILKQFEYNIYYFLFLPFRTINK